MQLDRRRLFRAGFGTGLGAAALAASTGGSNAQTRSTAEAPLTSTDLGIRPNSGRDETPRLQSAIDQAAARGVTLHLPAGRYIVSSLRLKPASRITGAGPSTILQQSTTTPPLVAENAQGISIANLAVAGGFPSADGRRGLIELRRCPHAEVADVVVETSTSSGIVLERCSGRVTRCRINGVERTGIFSLEADGNLEISHNELTRIGNNAIQVWRSAKGEDGTIVSFNRISHVAARAGGTGENGNAINVFRAGNVLVTSNRISDCAFSAVRANSASQVQILANNISRMGEVAIFVEFAFDGAVVSGNLVDGASAGVSVTNFDHGGRLAVVSGNLIRNIVIHRGPSDPGGYGIAVEADTSVSGNTIESAPTAGLVVGWGRFCRDISATGNVIRNCTIGISVTDDPKAGTALLANNVISGSKNGAIRGTNHGKPTTADLALQPPSPGRIIVTGNVTA